MWCDQESSLTVNRNDTEKVIKIDLPVFNDNSDSLKYQKSLFHWLFNIVYCNIVDNEVD